MFIGEFHHNIDAKNRLIMPSKLRNELGDRFIVTKGLDGCLNVFTLKQWEDKMNDLMKLPQTKKEVRAYIRSVSSKATECECDGQGRIQMPAYLLNEADIIKNIVIVGSIDHVEIWSEESWNNYESDNEGSLEEIAESLTEYLR